MFSVKLTHIADLRHSRVTLHPSIYSDRFHVASHDGKSYTISNEELAACWSMAEQQARYR